MTTKPKLRLRVQVGKDKMRVPCDASVKLSSLIQGICASSKRTNPPSPSPPVHHTDIVMRWARLNNGAQLHNLELRTADNVRLDSSDIVGDVFRDDEVVVAIVGKTDREDVRVGDLVAHYYLTEGVC